MNYVLDRTERDGQAFIPDLDIFVNDLSLPLWLALPPALLAAVYATNPRWVERARQRGEHLDEAEAARGG